MKKNCVTCGKEFEGRLINMACSIKCRQHKKKTNPITNCNVCNKECNIQRGRKYCSRECYYSTKRGIKLSSEIIANMCLAQKGKILSEEHKNKIRLSHLGKKMSDETKKKISLKSSLYRHSEETKKKISDTHKKIPPIWLIGIPFTEEHKKKIGDSIRGDKSYNWKGGITPINAKIRKSIEMRDWKKAVFKRDNYTCQNCFKKGGNGKRFYIEAHHIKSFAKFPELRFDLDNGMTLCRDCHKLTDSYGKNIKPEDITNL